MKKLLLTACLAVLTLAVAGGLVLGQAGRFSRQQQAIAEPAGQEPRPNRPLRRFPGGRRGNLPPLLDAEQGRRNRPNQQRQRRRQLLQQRLFQALEVTPEQRARMEEIRRNFADESIVIGRRVRQARSALNQAIMSEQYDEQLIRQRAEELAAAQAEQIRLQARIRAQVRSVLTTEQVMRFHEVQRRLRRQLREQNRMREQNQMREQGADTSRPPAPPEEEQADLLSLLLAER
ncbi:MAG TPA: Spy/CpxP family protein refolding chaperone [Blastocatellia bacterium]|nr:Spy/CpxP family protein refolding chaperone [Blastocatellia bacterium]